MQTHVIDYNGDSIYVAYSGGNPSSSTKYVYRRRRDHVINYSSVNGDKIKPNNFSYKTLDETYWQGVVQGFSFFNGKWTQNYSQQGCVFTDFGQGLSARALLDFPSVKQFHYNRALSRLNEKVRGGLDLSVSLFEAHSTKKMLLAAHKASSYIKNTMKGVKKGRKTDLIKDILKDVGGGYLQWHLGWDPLIKDLYSSVGELNRHLTNGMLDVTASSSSYIEGRRPLQQTSANDPKGQWDAVGKQGCRFHLRFKDKGGFNVSRYTSLNPVSIAWELMPLSFVFDYFYDIGGLLRATETSLLYDSAFVSGYMTELYALSGKCLINGARVDEDSTHYRTHDLQSNFSTKEFNRTVLGSYPLPQLPTFDVDLGSQQMLTIASLLAQQFR